MENKTLFSKIFNIDFGTINSDEVKSCIYGVAVKGNDGRYRAFDKKECKMFDVTGMTFKDGMLFSIPCALKDISVGDVIINAGNFVTVMKIYEDGTFSIVDPKASEQKIAIPAKNVFGFDFVIKVIFLLDGLIKPSEDNPFGIDPMVMLFLAGNGSFDTILTYIALLSTMSEKTDYKNLISILLAGKVDPLTVMALSMMNNKPANKRERFMDAYKRVKEQNTSPIQKLEDAPVPEGIEPYKD